MIVFVVFIVLSIRVVVSVCWSVRVFVIIINVVWLFMLVGV